MCPAVLKTVGALRLPFSPLWPVETGLPSTPYFERSWHDTQATSPAFDSRLSKNNVLPRETLSLETASVNGGGVLRGANNRVNEGGCFASRSPAPAESRKNIPTKTAIAEVARRINTRMPPPASKSAGTIASGKRRLEGFRPADAVNLRR